MIFQIFDFGGFSVCHLLDLSVSGTFWAPISEPRGSHLVPLPPTVSLLGSPLVPFGFLLASFWLPLVPIGSLVAPFGHPFLLKRHTYLDLYGATCRIRRAAGSDHKSIAVVSSDVFKESEGLSDPL